jgi:hypothetical protein
MTGCRRLPLRSLLGVERRRLLRRICRLVTQSGHCIYFVWCGYCLRLSIAKSVDKAQTSGSIHGRENRKQKRQGVVVKRLLPKLLLPH